MLHAAAMLLGMIVLWLMLAVDATPALAALAIFGASVCAIRLGAVSRALVASLRLLPWTLSRAPNVVRSALATARAALAADVPLRPALARVRARVGDGAGAFVGALSVGEGMLVVDAEPGVVLVHVTHEDPQTDVAARSCEVQVRRSLRLDGPA